MKRCLIIQFEPRHEEVIPSVVSACNAAGYRPTVFLHRRIKRLRGDIFELAPGGDADYRYARISPDAADSNVDLGEVLNDDFDFVIMNTLNRRAAADWAKNCGKPVIAFVHNADQFTGDEAFHGALQRPDFAFLTLGAHVLSELIARLGTDHLDRFGILTSCEFGDAGQGYRPGSPRKVVVPGNMSLRSRNYMELIEILSANPGRWVNLTFEFPSSGADRDKIEAEIDARGLGERMHILPTNGAPEVPHAQLFESLRSASLLHPLIPPDFAQYQRIKITSTTSFSLGFGIPLVMDRWSEACYRFPMLVSDNSLADSLDRLSDASDAELQALNAALVEYRREAQYKSGRDLARLIGKIT